MAGTTSFPRLRSRLYWWPTVTVALLVTQAALSLTLKQGPSLVAYCEISYLLLLLTASGVAAWNAIESRQTIRLFWSFLAVAFGLWALVPCSWFYNVVLHGKIPAFLFDNPPLFLHIVLLIAAVASRPHLRVPSHRPYRATLNFLVLLFVWVFAYAYLLFPYRYGQHASAMILRFESLYFTENLFLLGVLGMLIFRSRPPWKRIYWHLFGASALYAFGSLAANIIWALKDPTGDLTGASFPTARGLIGMVFTASISWFVWVGLQGRRLAPELAQTVQLDTAGTRYSSVLAMLAVLAIPIVGVWELFRTDEPLGEHEIRLLLVMIAVLLLAVGAFIQDHLVNSQFTSDVGLAHDRLRLAMESSKSMGWDWDLISGRSIWFGDLQTAFGIRSDTYLPGDQEFYQRLHPDDRERVSKAIADAIQNRKPYTAEFRIVRPDGSIRWVTDRGNFYYAPKGAPQRGLGVAMDVTERKQAEEAIRETEERFRLVANTAPVLIWMSGTDRLCAYFNKPWLEFTGQSLESQLGDGWLNGVHPEDLPSCLNTYTRAFERRETFRMEYRLCRRDGIYRWVVDIGVPRFIDNSFAGYIGSCIDITDSKLAKEALSDVNRRLIDAQEQERTRIARELHDDIGQRLALLTIELEEIKQHLASSDPEASTRMQDVAKRAVEIGDEVRALSHRLHSSQLEYLGVAAAAAGFCKELSEQQRVKIDFAQSGLLGAVPRDISLCLFRVLQEALHNAVKYSGVQRFAVQLRGSTNEIHLTVRDSGTGFDPEAAMNGRGLGLISMRERVSLVKGTISIASRLMRGTEISVRIPVDTGSAANQIDLSA
ncbi:MAG: PAS domain-containing protein [Terriglobales bacterium]